METDSVEQIVTMIQENGCSAIGIDGAGKTTLGIKLAKILGYYTVQIGTTVSGYTATKTTKL